MLTEKLSKGIASLNEMESDAMEMVDCLFNMKADLYSGKIKANMMDEPLIVLHIVLWNIIEKTNELLAMAKELERSGATR